LRLDFNTFVITGPNTFTTTSVKGINGAALASAAATALLLSYATQCLTDQFSVTGYTASPPVICGTNTGFHSNSILPVLRSKSLFTNTSTNSSVC